MTEPTGDYYLGVDVGGTFTDVILYEPSGVRHCYKVPTVPGSPTSSTFAAMDSIQQRLAPPEEVWGRLHQTHSSTIATNTLIERRGANVGLLTTAGFRDLFELQRLHLPHPMRFDSRRPAPLVRRALVREVRGRLDASGAELDPLDAEGVVRAAREFHEAGADYCVVCFIHSYKNPAHEQEARKLINERVPDLQVELSSDVWPQAREFERATLTAVNAYIRPTVERYLDALAEGLQNRGIVSPPRVARSNGGMEGVESTRQRPVVALLSGPAAGVAGASVAAQEAGWQDADLMTLDVGGTSADIGVIREGKAVLSTEEHVGDFPMLIPTIAVSSIGAGGGSVLWVGEGGTLKVGPRSVGSQPGPACYGTSDAGIPALTDAFVVAGILADGQELGGSLRIQARRAEEAVSRLGQQLGWSTIEVADGAIQIAVSMMAAEATKVLARRGVDAPTFRMVAFGGAGPLVAAMVAEQIFVDTILVPPTPGALSALGAAHADLEGDLVHPVYEPLRHLGRDRLQREQLSLERMAQAWAAEQSSALNVKEVKIHYSGELRYEGQGFDVSVPLKAEWLRGGALDLIAEAFHEKHRSAYGHSNPGAEIWIRELRAHVIGLVPKPHLARPTPPSPPESTGRRTVKLAGEATDHAVYSREHLAQSEVIRGPAIIEQMDTTTYIPAGWTGRTGALGSLVLTNRVGAT